MGKLKWLHVIKLHGATEVVPTTGFEPAPSIFARKVRGSSIELQIKLRREICGVYSCLLMDLQLNYQ